MKNKFKLLPLAFLGSLFVGGSYADENFFHPSVTYRTNFLGVQNPEFTDLDDLFAYWSYVSRLRFNDCMIDVQERNLEVYTCTESVFSNLRPLDENARRVNGDFTQYIYDQIGIDHRSYNDPDNPERIIRETQIGVTIRPSITLIHSCPDGISARSFNVTPENLDRYCVIPDTTINNLFSVGNPINFISRQKHDLVNDFEVGGGLQLSRYYVNQNEGWTLDDTNKLVDLYHVELGVPVAVNFKNSLMERLITVENADDDTIEVESADIFSPISYVVPDEANRKVLIADQYGITQSFLGGPTVFRSSVDSSLLTYTPENGEEPASWKLVNSSGVQQYFNNSGDVAEIRYPNGDIIFYQYDENNRVVKKENKLGDYIAYEYDTSGNAVKATVMPENIVFDYIYETIETGTYPDRLIEVKQDQVTTLKYQYDDLAFPLAMTSVTDGNDFRLAYWNYNVDGDAILTSPNNVEAFNLSYNHAVFAPRAIGGSEFNLGFGPIITNPDGSTTAHAIQRIAEYDREVAIIDRSEGVITEARFFTYDSDGNLTSETDNNGDVTVKVYDANRYLIQETSGYRWRPGRSRSGRLSNPLPSLTAVDTETTHHCWNAETGLRTRTITDELVTTFVYSELGQIINTIEEPVNSTNNSCY